MAAIPVAISRVDNNILIAWSDSSSRIYSPTVLRKACPCALCKEKNNAEIIEPKPMVLPVISMAETRPLQVTGMQPVGNYAYNIHFSDGHNSGIYDFQFLHELGQKA